MLPPSLGELKLQQNTISCPALKICSEVVTGSFAKIKCTYGKAIIMAVFLNHSFMKPNISIPQTFHKVFPVNYRIIIVNTIQCD
jgi:hypothetical protein